MSRQAQERRRQYERARYRREMDRVLALRKRFEEAYDRVLKMSPEAKISYIMAVELGLIRCYSEGGP